MANHHPSFLSIPADIEFLGGSVQQQNGLHTIKKKVQRQRRDLVHAIKDKLNLEAKK